MTVRSEILGRGLQEQQCERACIEEGMGELLAFTRGGLDGSEALNLKAYHQGFLEAAVVWEPLLLRFASESAVLAWSWELEMSFPLDERSGIS